MTTSLSLLVELEMYKMVLNVYKDKFTNGKYHSLSYLTKTKRELLNAKLKFLKAAGSQSFFCYRRNELTVTLVIEFSKLAVQFTIHVVYFTVLVV